MHNHGSSSTPPEGSRSCRRQIAEKASAIGADSGHCQRVLRHLTVVQCHIIAHTTVTDLYHLDFAAGTSINWRLETLFLLKSTARALAE